MNNCSAVVFGPRVHSWGCTRRGVIERNGKWYCRQHDPDAVKARMTARDAKWKQKYDRDDSIEAEGNQLAKRLGCGTPYWHTRIRGESGMERALIVDFADVRKLLKRLKPK